MHIIQSGEVKERFLVHFTLHEFELLKRCTNTIGVNYKKLLKKLILDALYKKQT